MQIFNLVPLCFEMSRNWSDKTWQHPALLARLRIGGISLGSISDVYKQFQTKTPRYLSKAQALRFWAQAQARRFRARDHD